MTIHMVVAFEYSNDSELNAIQNEFFLHNDQHFPKYWLSSLVILYKQQPKIY